MLGIATMSDSDRGMKGVVGYPGIEGMYVRRMGRRRMRIRLGGLFVEFLTCVTMPVMAILASN